MGSAWLKLTADARGRVGWPLHRVVIERMANSRLLRTAGRALKPEAHRLGDRLLYVALRSWRLGGKQGDPSDPIPVPPALLSEVTRLLFALPAPQRGRPPKASTLEAQRLLAELGSKLAAARAVSGKTGEPVPNLRRRLRPKKPGKLKRKRGT